MQALQAIAGISFGCWNHVHTYHARVNYKIDGSLHTRNKALCALHYDKFTMAVKQTDTHLGRSWVSSVLRFCGWRYHESVPGHGALHSLCFVLARQTIVLGEAVSLLCTAAAASMSPRSVMASSVTSSGLQPLTACESSCRKEAATAS